MSATSVLRHAKALIEDGWCQGAMSRIVDGGGFSYCMVGSLRQAYFQNAGDHNDFCTARIVLEEQINGCSLSSYNDQPGRTKEEVIQIFEKALQAVS